jgi:hypothetical protein
MEQEKNLLTTELGIDNNTESHLKESAMWAKFLGILGFVFSALILILAFVLPSLLERAGNYSRYDRDMASFGAAFITVAYIIIAAILFMVSMFVYRFAVKMKAALATNDQQSLNDSFKNLKFLFRFYGIIAIIYLLFIVLALLGGGLGAMMRS